MKRRKARPRHPFRFEMKFIRDDPDEKPKGIVHYAQVIDAKQPVEIELAADHARKSIKANGAGNTMTCTMAFCIRGNEDEFPHVLADGMIDFHYATAFIASRKGKHGLPTQCYCYRHNLGKIAKLNDTPGGQQRLLKWLEENGPMTLVLKPPRKIRQNPDRVYVARVRKPPAQGGITGTGARRRKAFLDAGGTPLMKTPTAA